METKHTKGPWRVDALGNVCGDDHPIARVEKGVWGDEYPTIIVSGLSLERKATAVMDIIAYGEIPMDEAKANANLIASAPLLLEALQELLKWRSHLPNMANDEILLADKAIHLALGGKDGE